MIKILPHFCQRVIWFKIVRMQDVSLVLLRNMPGPGNSLPLFLRTSKNVAFRNSWGYQLLNKK